MLFALSQRKRRHFNEQMCAELKIGLYFRNLRNLRKAHNFLSRYSDFQKLLIDQFEINYQIKLVFQFINEHICDSIEKIWNI